MGERSDRNLRNVRLRHADDLATMKCIVREQLTELRMGELGAEVAAYIAEYHKEHAVAPTRHETVDATIMAGLVPEPPPHMPSRFHRLWLAEGLDVIFCELRFAGWISFDPRPRSLRRGPRLTRRPSASRARQQALAS